MTLLPAVVPEIPEARSGIVPARLARKVGPLFGIRGEHSPYGLTWVSDYTKLTLSEIARGAPTPTRAETAEVEPSVGPGEWRVINRAVVTHRPANAQKPDPLPNEIANATLNRFGPDTKAAVILTAANTLLDPATAAVTTALTYLQEQTTVGLLPARLRVGAWAALVLEVFRSQPALFAAAAQARDIQRAVLQGWEIPTTLDRTCARVEIGGPEQSRAAAGSPSSPVDLAAVDLTVAAVQLDDSTGDARLSTIRTDWVRRELTRRWLSRLVTLGTVAGNGLLWLAEHDRGHRVVEAFAPHDPTLWSFLAEVDPLLPADVESALPARGFSSPLSPTTMPAISSASDLGSMDLLTRRAVVLALTTLVRLAFNSGSPDPTASAETLQTLRELSDLARLALPADDPVAAVTLCRIADMRLESLRQDAAHDAALGDAVDDLLIELEHCLGLVDRRLLNSSDVAELIRSGSVELMVLLRRHTPEHRISGVLPPDQLRARLGNLWKTMLELMQIDIDRLYEQSPVIQRLVGYQLHDYATFLGGHGSQSDAATAATLYRDFVVPARQEYYRQTGFFQPLLYTYQNATRATTRLAELAAAAHDSAAARKYAQQGRTWISMALDEPYTLDMLDRALNEATDEVCRFALLAVPALLGAVEHASSDNDGADLIACENLLGHAQRFADRFAKEGREYARAGELFDLTHRLNDLRERRAAQ